MFFDTFLALCEKKNIPPTRVALDIGLSKAAVTRWKQTESTPNGDVLSKLADYLGCSVDYLLDRDAPAEAKKDDSTEALSSAASLSSSQKQLVELAESLTDDEIKKVLSYIRFVLSERDGK